MTSKNSVSFAPDTGMPWEFYIGQTEAPWQLLGSFLNGVIGNTYGVASVDLSGAEYEEDLSTIGPICFKTDCENSVGEFQVCL